MGQGRLLFILRYTYKRKATPHRIISPRKGRVMKKNSNTSEGKVQVYESRKMANDAVMVASTGGGAGGTSAKRPKGKNSPGRPVGWQRRQNNNNTRGCGSRSHTQYHAYTEARANVHVGTRGERSYGVVGVGRKASTWVGGLV
jgi:hypothetical protein